MKEMDLFMSDIVSIYKMLTFVGHPTYARVWHMAFFIVRTRRRAIASTHSAVPKCLEPRRHCPKKGYLRRKAINLVPAERVRAWGRLPEAYEDPVLAAWRYCWPLNTAEIQPTMDRVGCDRVMYWRTCPPKELQKYLSHIKLSTGWFKRT